MLRSSILFLTLLLCLSSCKSGHKHSLKSYKAHKKLKVVKHKNQNPTLENSDFLYNPESEEDLKEHYKKNGTKRKELENYQPSRHNNKQEYERRKKKKEPIAPDTYY